MKNRIMIGTCQEGRNTTAAALRSMLSARRYKVELLHIGTKRLNLKRLSHCSDLILVLSPGMLDQCGDENDPVRRVIEYAEKNQLNMVAVQEPGFIYRSDLPRSVTGFSYQNSLWVRDSADEQLADRVENRLEAMPKPRWPGVVMALLLVAALIAGGVYAVHELRYDWFLRAQMLVTPGNKAYEMGEALEMQGDIDEAVICYDRAAQLDIGDAVIHLAEMYLKGDGVERDLISALGLFIQAADLGIMQGAERVGWMYDCEIGDVRDAGIAARWYERALELGSTAVCEPLGLLYLRGDGVGIDIARAEQLFEQGAEAGRVRCMLHLGMMIRDRAGDDHERGMQLIADAAAGGDRDAALELGAMYESPDYLGQDMQQAAFWYENAAGEGQPEAYYRLGQCYENGTGVKQDYIRAAVLYEQGIAAGKIQCISALGRLYENGYGLEQDEAKALELYLRAYEKGDVTAAAKAARLYEEGRGTQRDIDEAKHLYLSGAKQGDAAAQEGYNRLKNAR